jgi:hypothetical protein
MSTRSSTVVWPFTESIPIDGSFKGIKPPTEEAVLLNYLYQHEQLQAATKRQSTTRDAALKTVESLEAWWMNSGFKCKSVNGLVKMILKSIGELKELCRVHTQVATRKRKSTPKILMKERNFCQRLKRTFWAPSPDCEARLKVLSEKGVPEAVEDVQFLNNMRNRDRPGGVSSVDKVSSKKAKKLMKRKAEMEKRATKQLLKEKYWDERLKSVQLSDSSDDEDQSAGDDGDDFTVKQSSHGKQTITLQLDQNAFRTAGLAAEKNGFSSRGAAEFTAALIKGGRGSIEDIPLSKSNFARNKSRARNDKASELKQKDKDMIQEEGAKWVLHWDGKTLKKLQHTGQNGEWVAVVLTALHTDKEILLDVINMNDCEGEAGAEREARAIFAKLKEYGVDSKTLVGFVFDTTATNSGLLNGVVVRLQKLLMADIMQLACRHHIMELVCGAICGLVYHDKDKEKPAKGKKGKGTESPEEPLFKAFAAEWNGINTTNYQVFHPTIREHADASQHLVAFLLNWLETGDMRHDYRELVELTILYLGGVFPPSYEFSFKAPSAFHHARWMSKVLYTLKYALFGHQLKLECSLFKKIKSLASFLCLYYVKEWCTAGSSSNAPINDLAFYKKLSKDKFG